MNNQHEFRAPKRFGFTLVELLVALGIIAVLISLALPAVVQARAAARRVSCVSALRQLSTALHSYHSDHDMLPAGAYVAGASRPPQSGWGWGAMVLPHLESAALYESIDFDRPTADTANEDVMIERVSIFRCPSDTGPQTISAPHPDGGTVDLAAGNYSGSRGVLTNMDHVAFGDIVDGLSSTLMVGERVTSPPTSTALPYTAAWFGFVASSTAHNFHARPYSEALPSLRLNSDPPSASGFGSRHIGVANFAFCDGHVQPINESIDGRVFAALGTRDGGEAVSF